MDVIFYDGSFNHFLSTVCGLPTGTHYRILSRKRAQLELGHTEAILNSVPLAHARLMAHSILGQHYAVFQEAFYSERADIESDLAVLFQQCRRRNGCMFDSISNLQAVRVREAARTLRGEMHKFLGVLRFTERAEGLSAVIEPETNVLPFLGQHFRDRLGMMTWMIADLKRGYAVRCVNRQLETVCSTKIDSTTHDDTAELWREYFNVMEIRERRNTGLQRSNLPLRYRTHMTEFE